MTEPDKYAASIRDIPMPTHIAPVGHRHMTRTRNDKGRFTLDTERRAFIELAAKCTDADCLLWPYGRYRDGRALFYGPAARLVCERAHGAAPAGKPEAAHLCGNGHLGCVNGSHLMWKNHKENGADLARHGRVKGERHGMAKLTEADVLAIRNSPLPVKVLANQYNVHHPAITRIKSRQRWSHIK